VFAVLPRLLQGLLEGFEVFDCKAAVLAAEFEGGMTEGRLAADSRLSCSLVNEW